MPTHRQWAEVCFVPNKIGHSKNAPHYRYIVTREELQQLTLPGMQEQFDLPFPTMDMNRRRYKVFGTVTNLQDNGEDVIHWLDDRCGKSEQAHASLKHDFAGGKFPSNRFGANAAWWWVCVLAFNLNSIMKHQILDPSWATKRMKAIRFALIHLPGRLIYHSRKLILLLARNHPSLSILTDAREKITTLAFPYLT